MDHEGLGYAISELPNEVRPAVPTVQTTNDGMTRPVLVVRSITLLGLIPGLFRSCFLLRISGPAMHIQWVEAALVVGLLVFWLVSWLKTAKGKDRNNSPTEILRLERRRLMIDGLGLAIAVSILLDSSGVSEKLAGIIQEVNPRWSEVALHSIITVAGWVVSGIIGNAAYDWLKHKRKSFRQAFSRSDTVS